MNDSPQRHEGHKGAGVGFRFALPNLQLQLGKGGHEPTPPPHTQAFCLACFFLATDFKRRRRFLPVNRPKNHPWNPSI